MSESKDNNNDAGHDSKKFSNHLYAAEKVGEKDSHPDEGGAPARYGVDYVAIIPKSPTSLFVYWELSGRYSRYCRENCPEEWFLSLINLKDSGEVSWRSEIPVSPDAGNHYLRVQPGNRYRVELGVRKEGGFHPICHSRERQMPHDAPTTAAGESGWMQAEETSDSAQKGGEKSRRPEEKKPAGLVWEEGLFDTASST